MAWHPFKHWHVLVEKIKHEPKLQWLGHKLHDPQLWRWQRTPIARAVGLGLLLMFIPIPLLQMVVAGFVAYFCRANIPITVAFTWLNNPFTFVPINFFIYKIGDWILGARTTMPTMRSFEWPLSHISLLWREMLMWFKALGKPYFLGLGVVAIGSAVIGYLLVEIIWRICTYIHKKRNLNKE